MPIAKEKMKEVIEAQPDDAPMRKSCANLRSNAWWSAVLQIPEKAM